MAEEFVNWGYKISVKGFFFGFGNLKNYRPTNIWEQFQAITYSPCWTGTSTLGQLGGASKQDMCCKENLAKYALLI